ncbi:hypothetical protein [Pandoraea sp. CB10b_02]|uniref:hypothetical protein n=1 Tax=Pandoraea sp. CB10b_02 TaxID=2014535 RepID=UPI00257D3960|nr:hypothetical protein [Pandoraea sp. CB10b_02]
MRHDRLVRAVCFALLSGASLGAAAQSASDGRFFRGWFAQGAERPGARGDGRGDAAPRGTRPSRPPEVRPQGDLRGDIYNHLREQRQPPAPAPPAGAPGQPGERKSDRGNRGR